MNAFFLLFIFASAGTSFSAEPSIGAAVSIAPQKYFLEKIGGAHVTVTVMVPPGADPHVFEPKPAQLVALSRAKLYFGIGMPFERAWLPRFKSANPGLVVVFTDEGVKKIPMSSGDSHDAKGVGGEGLDPHVWLSPPAVRIVAASMRNALEKADPSHRADYESGYRAFVAEIDSLDNELRILFSGRGDSASRPYTGRVAPTISRARFMVFHPAWGYFEDAYGLEQIPIEIEGREPTPAELVRITGTAKKLHIPAIFVQPQKSSRSARTVADAVGAKIVPADDLAENWTANLRAVARAFHDALR